MLTKIGETIDRLLGRDFQRYTPTEVKFTVTKTQPPFGLPMDQLTPLVPNYPHNYLGCEINGDGQAVAMFATSQARVVDGKLCYGTMTVDKDSLTQQIEQVKAATDGSFELDGLENDQLQQIAGTASALETLVTIAEDMRRCEAEANRIAVLRTLAVSPR